MTFLSTFSSLSQKIVNTFHLSTAERKPSLYFFNNFCPEQKLLIIAVHQFISCVFQRPLVDVSWPHIYTFVIIHHRLDKILYHFSANYFIDSNQAYAMNCFRLSPIIHSKFLSTLIYVNPRLSIIHMVTVQFSAQYTNHKSHIIINVFIFKHTHLLRYSIDTSGTTHPVTVLLFHFIHNYQSLTMNFHQLQLWNWVNTLIYQKTVVPLFNKF